MILLGMTYNEDDTYDDYLCWYQNIENHLFRISSLLIYNVISPQLLFIPFSERKRNVLHVIQLVLVRCSMLVRNINNSFVYG